MGKGAAEVGQKGGRAAIDKALAAARPAAAPPPPKPPTPLRTVCLADVAPEEVGWLWEHRIPFGKISILDGDPGLGKSTVTLALIAYVTTGRALPHGVAREPAAAVLASTEDGLGDTIRPRLDAAGADVSRVHAIPLDEGFRIPEDVGRLEETIKAKGAKLVIIDPLMAVLSAERSSHNDQDVRGALAPLAAVADRTGAAVLIVRHLNKSGTGPAMYRGGGSIGITGAARSVLLLAQDPDDESARILARVKCNLAPPVRAMRLRLVTEGDVARIEWAGDCDATADDLLQVVKETPEKRGAVTAAEDALREILDGAPVLTVDVEQQAKAVGVKKRTLWRAKERLNVIAKRRAGRWWWCLPGQWQEPPAPAPLPPFPGNEAEGAAA